LRIASPKTGPLEFTLQTIETRTQL